MSDTKVAIAIPVPIIALCEEFDVEPADYLAAVLSDPLTVSTARDLLPSLFLPSEE